MRKGGGKQKGASKERLVCKQLSLWVSGGAQEDCYWRSSMSGGRSTVAFKGGKRLAAQAGDISCIHPIGQWFLDIFCIEVKHYADLNFVGLITGKGNLIAFWEEIGKQAARYDKLPILIAQQNRQPTIVCLTQDGLFRLHLGGHSILTHHETGMNILLFDDFLKYAKKI